MTGTEKGRPEVVLEYSNDMNGPWKEFNFLYKPTDVAAAPTFVCKLITTGVIGKLLAVRQHCLPFSSAASTPARLAIVVCSFGNLS